MPRSRPAPVTIATFPSRYPMPTLSSRPAAGRYVTGFAHGGQHSPGPPGAAAPGREGALGLDEMERRSQALARVEIAGFESHRFGRMTYGRASWGEGGAGDRGWQRDRARLRGEVRE